MPAKRKPAAKKRPAAKKNPAPMIPKSKLGRWIPASAVKFSKPGGRLQVEIRKRNPVKRRRK